MQTVSIRRVDNCKFAAGVLEVNAHQSRGAVLPRINLSVARVICLAGFPGASFLALLRAGVAFLAKRYSCNHKFSGLAAIGASFHVQSVSRFEVIG